MIVKNIISWFVHLKFHFRQLTKKASLICIKSCLKVQFTYLKTIHICFQDMNAISMVKKHLSNVHVHYVHAQTLKSGMCKDVQVCVFQCWYEMLSFQMSYRKSSRGGPSKRLSIRLSLCFYFVCIQKAGFP